MIESNLLFIGAAATLVMGAVLVVSYPAAVGTPFLAMGVGLWFMGMAVK